MEAIETGFKAMQVADVVSPHPRQSQYRRHLLRRHLEQILITKVKKPGVQAPGRVLFSVGPHTQVSIWCGHAAELSVRNITAKQFRLREPQVFRFPNWLYRQSLPCVFADSGGYGRKLPHVVNNACAHELPRPFGFRLYCGQIWVILDIL